MMACVVLAITSVRIRKIVINFFFQKYYFTILVTAPIIAFRISIYKVFATEEKENILFGSVQKGYAINE
jgi:hypothetical protein